MKGNLLGEPAMNLSGVYLPDPTKKSWLVDELSKFVPTFAEFFDPKV